MNLTSYLAIALSCGLCGSNGSAYAAPGVAPIQLAQGTADAPADAPTEPKKPEGVVRARGKIKAIARPPKPRSVPYKDAVIAIHLVDVEALDGKVAGKEILVFGWGMRDNKWTAAADYRVGQTIELSLRPWDEVADQYGSYNRIELEGEEIFLLEPYWAEAEPPPA